MEFTGIDLDNKYIIKDELWACPFYRTYRVSRIDDGRVCLARILNPEVISDRLEDAIRYNNDIGGINSLNNSVFAKVIEVLEVLGHQVVISDFIEGKSLYERFNEGEVFTINDVISISLQVVQALQQAHMAGLLHKDLNTKNIFLVRNGDSLSVKIIDFGLFQLKQFDRIGSISDLLYLFTYKAPEVCGVLNRKIEGNSDLYSLGIIMYELLTGKPPFKGDKVNTLIHQHIAKEAEAPSTFNNQIPEILNKIILKILEKEPGKRYQSSKGLARDLESFEKGERDFILGLEDEILNLRYKTRLIGRDEELAKIKNSLDKAVSGSGNITFVFGASGLGKTRLIEELVDYCKSGNIVHIKGKCFAGVNKFPYEPFKDALIEYLDVFKHYSEKRQNQIRKEVEERVGDLGQIILDVEPEMSVLIKNPPPLVKLDEDKESKRFLMTLSQFFCTLADAEGGFLLFLDDLQWADKRSLELIRELGRDISNSRLLLSGTYRDDEIYEGHGLNLLIKNAIRQEQPLTQIHVHLFDDTRMVQFISSILHHKSDKVNEIAGFVQKQSSGNPFFAIEITKQLVSDEVIYYENDDWHISQELLDTLEISSGVIDFIIKRISLFESYEIEILSVAAIIGRIVEFDTLFSLCSQPNSTVVEVIDKAIRLNLIDFQPTNRNKIFFVHDRIREAFYEIVPHTQRKKMHFKVARTIETLYQENPEEVLFSLTHHYICAENEDKVLEFALPAAKKAKANYANEEGVKYLNIIIDILEKRNNHGSEVWIDAVRNLAEIYLFIGEYDKGISYFNALLPYIEDSLSRGQVYKLITDAYYRNGDYQKCEDYAKKGLKILGENLPGNNLSVTFNIIKELFIHLMHIFFPFIFNNQKEKKKSDRHKLIVRFYYTVSWSYILSDLSKFFRSILRMLNRAEAKIGRSKELAMSTSAYASLCMAVTLFKRSDRYHSIGLEMKKSIRDDYGIAQSMQFLGFLYEWRGIYSKAVEYFKNSGDEFKRIGDIKEYGVNVIGIVECYYYTGRYKEARGLMDIYFRLASRDVYALSNAYCNYTRIYLETGDYAKAEEVAKKGYDLSQANDVHLIHALLSMYMGMLYVERNEISKAIILLNKSNELDKKYKLLPHYISSFLFSIMAEAYLVKYSMQIVMDKKESWVYLKKIERLCLKSLSISKKWVTNYGAASRVFARYNALIGKQNKAKKFFLQSIRECEKYNRQYELGKSLYAYGVFLNDNKQEDDAKAFLKKAYKFFTDIDNKPYMKKTAEALGLDHHQQEEMLTSNARFMNKQRFSSIIEVSQDIGSILSVEELLDKVLQKAIEITGAQRGFLFIYDEKLSHLELMASKNKNAGELPPSVIKLSEEVFAEEKSIIGGGTDDDIKSILCVPLRSKNEIIGVCYLDNKLSNEVFSFEDKEVLEVIMVQAAISIVNARLYELATRDGLTRLYMHRHFQFLLLNEVKRSRRYNHPCSLIMMDIDFFKLFNDRYGHPVGDKVLRAVANIIKTTCRNTDIPARYGGEEFSLILPETDRYMAAIVADKIRKAVEDYELKHNNEILRVTISLGIGEFPYCASTKEELIKTADDALYDSKRNGRNRVTIYQAEHL